MPLVTHWRRDKMDAISQTTFSNEFSWMKMIEFRLKLHWSLFPINNIPALLQIMAWRHPGDKSLSEPIRVSLTTNICVARPQWVDNLVLNLVDGCMVYIPDKAMDVNTYRCPGSNIVSFRNGAPGYPKHMMEYTALEYPLDYGKRISAHFYCREIMQMFYMSLSWYEYNTHRRL